MTPQITGDEFLEGLIKFTKEPKTKNRSVIEDYIVNGGDINFVGNANIKAIDIISTDTSGMALEVIIDALILSAGGLSGKEPEQIAAEAKLNWLNHDGKYKPDGHQYPSELFYETSMQLPPEQRDNFAIQFVMATLQSIEQRYARHNNIDYDMPAFPFSELIEKGDLPTEITIATNIELPEDDGFSCD